MSAKHTPGPWKADRGDLFGEDPERWSVFTSSNPHYFICTVENGAPGDTLESEEANARLIAAAPDYYAAAISILATHDEHARRCNASECGCDVCNELRPIVSRVLGANP